MCLLSFSLALPIKSALFALALVLALSGLGLFLAKVALYNKSSSAARQPTRECAAAPTRGEEKQCGQTGAPEPEEAAKGAEEDTPQEERRSMLGTLILGTLILGTHILGKSISGTFISGSQKMLKIEQITHRADRNGKAVTPARGRDISGTFILGTSILGTHILGTC